MNEEVTKTISHTIDGFQWVLVAILIGVIVLWLIQSYFGKKKR